jgi:hypothetical protein
MQDWLDRKEVLRSRWPRGAGRAKKF